MDNNVFHTSFLLCKKLMMVIMEAIVMMSWKSEKMVVGSSLLTYDSGIVGGEMCPIFIG